MSLSRLRYFFTKRPLAANMVSFTAMYVGAEFSQQTILKYTQNQPPTPYKWDILGKYALYATTVAAPLLHVWFKFLDKTYASTLPKIVVKKVLIDQVVSANAMLVTFYLFMSLLDSKTDVFEELKVKWWPSYQLSCCFWLPAQTINFALVTPPFRVVYVGMASFLWVNVLCILKRQKYKEEENRALER